METPLLSAIVYAGISLDDCKFTERIVWINATAEQIAALREYGYIVNKNTAMGHYRWWVRQ